MYFTLKIKMAGYTCHALSPGMVENSHIYWYREPPTV